MHTAELLDTAIDWSAEIERLQQVKDALEFSINRARVGEWDLDLVHDTSRRSLRHDQCFGYVQPVRDWGAKTFLAHVHPDDREQVEATMAAAMVSLQGWSADFRVTWPDGSLHWLNAAGGVYVLDGSPPTRMLGIVMDITDRKRAEFSLAAINQDLQLSEAALRGSERTVRAQLDTLTRTLEASGDATGPDRLLEQVLRTLTDELQGYGISVWMRDPLTGLISYEGALDGNRFTTVTNEAGDERNRPVPLSDLWPCAPVFDTGRPAVLEDVRTIGAFRWQDRLIKLGIVTVLFVPMAIGGRVAGFLSVRFSKRRAFRPDELDLSRALANQAMLAIELARLSRENARAALIAERNRMARDMHDTLAQGFTGIIVQLQATQDARDRGLPDAADEHLGHAVALARASLGEARRSVLALRTLALEGQNLCEALTTMFDRMTVGTRVTASVTVEGQARALPVASEDHLLRIGQEVLTNVLRHAGASQLLAHVRFDADGIELAFSDDGCGFDPLNVQRGLGLRGMHERATAIGSMLNMRSSIGGGTTIGICIPHTAGSPIS